MAAATIAAAAVALPPQEAARAWPLRGEETFASRAAKAAAASSRRCCARIRASVAAREALLLPEKLRGRAIGGGDGGLVAGAAITAFGGPRPHAPRRFGGA